MPFDRDGKWVDPGAVDEAAFVKALTEESTQTFELPGEIQAQLERAVSGTVDFKNIEHLNKTSYHTLSNVINSPGHVSVVIPIYGALHLVKKCIESVFRCTHWPFELILVDDCSPDPAVLEYLKTLEGMQNQANSCIGLKVIANKKNKGFAATCNTGMNASNGKYVCVLNSDVLVTPYWLTKMVTAIEADPSHVIVNPCTNNTALINIPMEPGRSYLDMNRALERKSPKSYPEIMPTGFCLFFRRTLLDKIGGFDEAYVSYGEDTHFWFQSLKLTNEHGEYLGNKAVMADDCYIFHERSSSFNQIGKDEHMGLRRSGSERFHTLNPSFNTWKANYNVERVMQPLRLKSSGDVFEHDYKYNVAWVVKSAEFCGGMKYIADIANELIARNVNVKICVIKSKLGAPEQALNDLHTAPVFFTNEEDFVTNFASKCFSNGVVIAAVSEMVYPVGALCNRIKTLTPVHHVQSYDPELVIDRKLAEEVAAVHGKLKYTISSSCWITKVLKDSGVDNVIFTTQPGVDTSIFHKGDRSKGDDRFTVMVALNTQYPFKGYDRGLELCKEIVKLDKNIRILGLGIDFVPECQSIVGLGKLSQGRLAQLLRTEVDVFVDPSFVHSYGMPSLEALACGAEVVCWNNRGILEYANNSMPGVHILLPTAKADEVARGVLHVKTHRADVNIDPFDRADSVANFIHNFEQHLNLVLFKKRITVVTPHARKHGGPTTIINLANVLHYLGHDVKLVSIYDDFNNEVVGLKHVPLYLGIDNIKESDMIIVNSDNPFIEQIINQPAVKNAKKVLLKLSHNPRFKAIEEASLRMPVWDKIVTSTEHLREKTITPIPDWRHISWNPDKVKTIGWYHYAFPLFDAAPHTRQYGTIDRQVRIGYLIHDHPTKGTAHANAIVKALKKKYGANVDIIAVGEVALKERPPWLTHIFKPTRPEMAQVMKQCDIWLGSSMNEGLGRMALEAMASGCAIVTTDTGADYLKHGENCLLYPVGDAQEGGLTVDKLISDYDLFKKLVVNGYNTAKQMAKPDKYLFNLRGLVRELCK